MAIYQLSKDEPNDGIVFISPNIEDDNYATKCMVIYSPLSGAPLDFKSGDIKRMSQNSADDNKIVINFEDAVFSSSSGDSIIINGTIVTPYYGTIEFPLGNN